jgi:hypothetical protein
MAEADAGAQGQPRRQHVIHTFARDRTQPSSSASLRPDALTYAIGIDSLYICRLILGPELSSFPEH